MAQKYTQEPGGAQRGGDLGVFPKGAMVPQFEQAVAALKPGQVSPLVKTQFGYHIIRRSTYPEVAAEVAQRVNGPALQAADSVYISKLEACRQHSVQAERRRDHQGSGEGSGRASRRQDGDRDVQGRRLHRLASHAWMEAFQQREDLGKRLQTAPDSIVLSFARNVLRNELVLHQADSAKIALIAG